MKYIVTATEDSGDEEIFIFPSTVNHDIMAEAICALKNKNHGPWKRIYRKPVSAGFVEGGQCTGRSETLNLSSRQQDTSLLNFIPKKRLMKDQTSPEIIQKRLEILQWERENRNLINRNAKSDGCRYEPYGGERKYGCAVGRLLPTEIQQKCDSFYCIGQGSSVTNANILKRLPEDVLALGKKFLQALQGLHDDEDNWAEKGMSKYGYMRIEEMKRIFCKMPE